MNEEDQYIHKVLYTKDLTQKAKRKYDGFIIFKKKSKRIELYEDDNDKMGRQILIEQINESEIEEGMTISTSVYLIEVYEQITSLSHTNATGNGHNSNGNEMKEIEEKRKETAKPMKVKLGMTRKKTTPKPLITSINQGNKKNRLNHQLQQKRSVEEIIKLFEDDSD